MNTSHEQDWIPRSRLYSLNPYEKGTLWTECLTSYLNRLAWAHHISPRAMIAQEIVPYLEKVQGYCRQWIGSLSRGYAMSINGSGMFALEWSTLLERLTLHPDLHLLTLQWWIGNLSSQGHLRAYPAWCPACYAEWQEQKRCIYQPLLWSFNVVTMCPKHLIPLESSCPDCQKKQSVVALQTDPGHCTQCNRRLGTPLNERLPFKMGNDQIDWQQWVVQALDELRTMSSTGPLQWEPFFTHLAQGFTSAADLVAWEQIENVTGIRKHVLYPWFHLKKVPSLETILKLCYVCEVTPVQIMKGEIASLLEVLQRGTSSRPSLHRRTRPTVDLDSCRELIQAVLDGREKPLSQNQLCKLLGCGHHKLQHFFPKERALIVQKAREYRKQQDKQRIAKACEQVRQAVFSLHVQGIYPSLHKVQSFLSAGVMLQSEVRETWHATLRELGLGS